MTKRFRALVVDDERLARTKLRSMLEDHGQVEVVGEADCVAEALRLYGKEQPDVVFLDIQMPGESGFDFFEQLARPG